MPSTKREVSKASEAIAKILKDYRKKLNLTQTDLANLVGVSQHQVCRWENTTRPITIDKVYEIANIFGLTMKEIGEKIDTVIQEILSETPKPKPPAYVFEEPPTPPSEDDIRYRIAASYRPETEQEQEHWADSI